MFKKIALSASLALSLVVSAQAVTLYPNGVISPDGVSLADLLSDGWTVAHNTGYGSGAITQTDISAWGAAAGAGGYVFVGGIDQNGNVVLGATGLASEVLSQTYSDYTAVQYSSSNLYWYNEDHNIAAGPVGAFGFAPSSDVYLFQADTSDSSNPYRLSWHLNYDGGGYRLGAISGLNSDNSYNRIVLVGQAGPSNPRVPESGSTALLLGAALVSVAAFRRRTAK